MFPRPNRAAALPAAVALLIGGAAVPAAAAGTDDVPPGLMLTIADGPHAPLRGVLLTCPPLDATHPHAAAACALLDQSHGDLDALAIVPHPCTREYHPVAAGATGEWQGRPVHWERTFANPCMLDSATGPLFRF